jgi:hypothetical protein
VLIKRLFDVYKQQKQQVNNFIWKYFI